jgi:ABC-2 type transport system permease protein
VSAFLALVEVTLRALLGRRRTILLVLLAGLPVLVALLARIGGGRMEGGLEPILELAVRTVLPLTALVFGTSSLGSEIEDGTAVYLLAKPVPRSHVAVAKTLVAGMLAAALAAVSTVLTGLLIGGFGPTSLGTTFAFALGMTGRALVVGLFYTLVWEGLLAGILEGTRLFSLREATLTVVQALAPTSARIRAELDPATAAVLLAAVLVGSVAVTTARLRVWEIKGVD